jgi:hypothetical protein
MFYIEGYLPSSFSACKRVFTTTCEIPICEILVYFFTLCICYPLNYRFQNPRIACMQVDNALPYRSAKKLENENGGDI